MDTQERLRDFITQNFYVGDTDELALDTHLINSGIVDSTGILEVIGFIEQEFGIRVEDGETIPENLASMARILAFVARKRSVPAAKAS